MSGIAGLVLDKEYSFQGYLKTLSSLLFHRGSDDQGFLLYSSHEVYKGKHLESRPFRVGLVHCRLSILDFSESGWQPLSTLDGQYHVILDGTIYNYLELRAELEAQGHIFRSQSDAEVLLAAWATWGPEALNRFVGMFAFALLDLREESLFLVRDFFRD